MPNAIQSELILKWHGRGSKAGEIADLLKLPEALVQSVIDNSPQDKDRFKVRFVEQPNSRRTVTMAGRDGRKDESMPGRNFHNGFRRETVDIDDPEVRAFIEHCRAGDVSNEETSERRGFREKRAETPEREPCGK